MVYSRKTNMHPAATAREIGELEDGKKEGEKREAGLNRREGKSEEGESESCHKATIIGGLSATQ